MKRLSICGAVVFCTTLCVGSALSQETFTIDEKIAVGRQYHVSNRVQVSGQLILPNEKKGDKVAQITVIGKSSIEYDERILSLSAAGDVERTIRFYDELSFARKVGDHEQANELRKQVRRLVMIRKNQTEVAFSPNGPLTWGELDLLRTDVFTPALRGMFPKQAVAVGAAWTAAKEVVQELTDLAKIESGSLSCRFKDVLILAGRRHARVDLSGTVSGFGDEGRSQHQLSGYFFFDLDRGHLSYLFVSGKQLLFNEKKTVLGRIQGTFVLTRFAKADSDQLSDAQLRTLTLEPNESNTRLLFESTQLGIRFLHPRRWRVSGGDNDQQLVVEEPMGNGFLITVEPPQKSPSASRFHQEVRNWLIRKKATIQAENRPRYFASGIEQFDFTAKLDGQNVKLDYYAVRQSQGGATVAARYIAEQWRPLQSEVQSIVRSMEILPRTGK